MLFPWHVSGAGNENDTALLLNIILKHITFNLKCVTVASSVQCFLSAYSIFSRGQQGIWVTRWSSASCDHQSYLWGYTSITVHLSSSPGFRTRRSTLVFSCAGFMFGSPGWLCWTIRWMWAFTQEEVLPDWYRLFHRRPVSCLRHRKNINLAGKNTVQLTSSWGLFSRGVTGRFLWCKVQVKWGLNLFDRYINSFNNLTHKATNFSLWRLSNLFFVFCISAFHSCYHHSELNVSANS